MGAAECDSRSGKWELLIRAKQADLMPTLQECGSLAVKLLRTYAAQVEALARLRRPAPRRGIGQEDPCLAFFAKRISLRSPPAAGP